MKRFGAGTQDKKANGESKATSPASGVSQALLKLGVAVGGMFAVMLALLCITQPFNTEAQVLFLGTMLLLALGLTRLRARISLMLLFVISIVVSGRYLWWRSTQTLNTGSLVGMAFSLLLLASEAYAFIVMALWYFQVCWVLDRKPCPMPEDRSLWPHVDIFITTYNEPLSVIRPTLFAALNQDWPADKLHVYVLDDGSRPEFERFALEAGAGYIRRTEHRHAKAGNINHALSVTGGELIAIFDCDHVPAADFLRQTAGWLIRRPNVALVQTPHHFYSPDPFQKNWHLDRKLPGENSLFHDFIQKGNDTWNATMFCGSNALIRRSALEEIGGIAVETVTEDAHTSLKLTRRGWSSVYLDQPLAAGLSTETLASHVGQRIRWARGMVQIFRVDNPMLGRGLSLPQRLCYLNAMMHFFHGLPRLVFLLAPLPYMFADIYVIYATAATVFAYVIPHMVHSAITGYMLQRGRRIPFLGAVYETVLSWYILLPTTVALFAPSRGKFNVTSKGEVIGRRYLDWGIAKPFLVLIALNAAGLVLALWRGLTGPGAEAMSLAINTGWISYNLLLLGAALAAAIEERQTLRFPRVPLEVPVRVRGEDGRSFVTQTTQFSQQELALRVPSAELGETAPGRTLEVELSVRGEPFRFACRVASVSADNEAVLDVSLPDTAAERRFNRCTFSRPGVWGQPGDSTVCTFWEGLGILVRLAVDGYQGMIQYLPRASARSGAATGGTR